MEIKTIWETPKESINGASRISLDYTEGNLKLKLIYVKNNIEMLCELIFEDVVCFRHIGGHFIKAEELEAYEKLIEFNNSDWINELKTRNAEEFKFWNAKHFSLYTEDDRLFDVIAKKVTIIKNKCRNYKFIM